MKQKPAKITKKESGKSLSLRIKLEDEETGHYTDLQRKRKC